VFIHWALMAQTALHHQRRLQRQVGEAKVSGLPYRWILIVLGHWERCPTGQREDGLGSHPVLPRSCSHGKQSDTLAGRGESVPSTLGRLKDPVEFLLLVVLPASSPKNCALFESAPSLDGCYPP
jgi:hypothetical protein